MPRAYSILQGMRWETALAWLQHDTRDDFFPDPIRYADVFWRPEVYLEAQRHRRLQVDEMCGYLKVPKAWCLTREAVWLPISTRLAYVAVMVEVFDQVVDAFSDSCYAFGRMVDDRRDENDYPYPTHARMSAWFRFRDDFRRDLSEGQGNYGVTTDLANFFEHIRVSQVVGALRRAGESRGVSAIPEIADFLEGLLHRVSDHGRGLPQNYDPSSFLSALLFLDIDRSMERLGIGAYRRYVDDIRISARTRADALHAVNELQSICQNHGFFLNSSKTKLLEPGEELWVEMLDATMDAELGQIEEALEVGTQERISQVLPIAIAGVNAARSRSDGRRMRAYAGRLLEIAKFRPFRDEALSQLREAAFDGLRSQPNMADQWSRFISAGSANDTAGRLGELLSDPDQAVHSWTNMHVFIALNRCPNLPGSVMDIVRRLLDDPGRGVAERAWASVVLGKAGDSHERREVLRKYVRADQPPILLRSAVIATQECPGTDRDAAWRSVAEADARTSALIEYLNSRREPTYDTWAFEERELSDEPAEATDPGRGFGVVAGQRRSFRRPKGMFSNYD